MHPQAFLDFLVQFDSFGFLNVSGNWDNHRPLLYLAIMLNVKNRTVVEFGSGDGSTDLLRSACKGANRNFFSYDNNESWAEKTDSNFVEDWDKLFIPSAGIYFLDHAPGERRQKDLERLNGELFVCHDTEIGGAGNYGWDFSKFKYQLHLNRRGGGAGASMLSNAIEINRFAGMNFGRFKFDE